MTQKPRADSTLLGHAVMRRLRPEMVVCLLHHCLDDETSCL